MARGSGVRVCAVDFDGTLHDQAWRFPNVPQGPKTAWADELLDGLTNRGYTVYILSARAGRSESRTEMWRWLQTHELVQYIAEITDRKLPIFEFLIDDRAIRARPGVDEMLLEVDDFLDGRRPWWTQQLFEPDEEVFWRKEGQDGEGGTDVDRRE